MPRDTLVWLPLQSRGALVRRRHVLSPNVVVLHCAAVTPTYHCKEMVALEPFPKAVFPKLTDSCVELISHVGGGETIWKVKWVGRQKACG